MSKQIERCTLNKSTSSTATLVNNLASECLQKSGDGNPELLLQKAAISNNSENSFANAERVPGKVPRSAWIVCSLVFLVNGARLSSYRIYQNYIQNALPSGDNSWGASEDHLQPSGALGLGQQAASGLTNAFFVLGFLLPILFGGLADSRFGRLRMIALGTAVFTLGIGIVTITSAPFSIEAKAGLPGLCIGTFFMAVGGAASSNNLNVFAGDQLESFAEETRISKDGKTVVTDKELTISRLYNIVFFIIYASDLLSIGTTFIEKYVGYWPAFLLSTCSILPVCGILLLQRKTFIHVEPRPSILSEAKLVVKKVLRGCFRHPIHWWQEARSGEIWLRAKMQHLPEVSELSYENTEVDGYARHDDFVDQMRKAIPVLGIFAVLPFWELAYQQVETNTISQAAQLKSSTVPNDFFPSFTSVTVLCVLPLLDTIIFPALRRCRVPVGPLSRFIFGFLFAGLAMTYAAVLQHFIYTTNTCPPGDACKVSSPISVFAQIPVYCLIALSESFTQVALMEIAFSYAPKSLRALVMSISSLAIVCGYGLNFAMLSLARDYLAVWLYSVNAVLVVAAAGVYVLIWRHFQKSPTVAENGQTDRKSPRAARTFKTPSSIDARA